ncbi:sulfatase-like hydrolase/transferase [Halomontanus rarus]|uniref:sulfatase-like hydrolase/transferase n=1 Tax=Halomontanus rarus TaxID=3034020 RepID=UPI001A995A4E
MSTHEPSPNVLLVLTRQQRWDTVGAYGNPMGLTPTLDELAAQGTLLKQAITPQPTCSAGKVSMLTGKYATEVGVWRGSQPVFDERTLGHYFSEAGYDVGFVGGWHLAGTFDEPVPPEKRGGFEDFWIGADSAEFTTRPNEGTLYDEDGTPVEFDGYRADAFTDFAETAIESLEDPFCLVVSYLEPHHQNDMQTFVAPDGYAERHTLNPYIPDDLQGRPGDWYEELPDYYGMCKRLDECVSRLLRTLEDEGSRDDTIVAYTSDHGCHFRTRPGEYKRTCHESAVRVPAILSGPGFDTRRTIDQVRSLVDLGPTLLDAAGVAIPTEMDGESFLPLARGEAPEREGEAFIQISEAEIGRAVRTDRWKYAISAPSENGWRAGSGDPDSNVYMERYLYDLHRDPAESVNLIGRHDYQDVADSLRERLRTYLQDVEGADPEIRTFDVPGYHDLAMRANPVRFGYRNQSSGFE